MAERWFAADFDDSAWADLRTDTEVKGWGQDTGVGWYRNKLAATAQDLEGKHAYLYFGACDEDAWVYLDGKQVFEHSFQTTGRMPSEIWNRPFVVPLTGAELGGKDLLAVRIHNAESMGGIWKPVRLILSDRELTGLQVRMLAENPR